MRSNLSAALLGAAVLVVFSGCGTFRIAGPCKSITRDCNGSQCQVVIKDNCRGWLRNSLFGGNSGCDGSADCGGCGSCEQNYDNGIPTLRVPGISPCMFGRNENGSARRSRLLGRRSCDCDSADCGCDSNDSCGGECGCSDNCGCSETGGGSCDCGTSDGTFTGGYQEGYGGVYDEGYGYEGGYEGGYDAGGHAEGTFDGGAMRSRRAPVRSVASRGCGRFGCGEGGHICLTCRLRGGIGGGNGIGHGGNGIGHGGNGIGHGGHGGLGHGGLGHGGLGHGGLGHGGVGGHLGGHLGGHGLHSGGHPYGGAVPHTAQPPNMGGTAPSYAYPYYTTRGPRDFLQKSPPSIGY